MQMRAQTTVTASRLPEVEAKAWALANRVGVFGYAEVSAELSISIDVARRIVGGWLEAGKVQVRTGGGTAGRKMFELPVALREPTDRASAIAQQLWTAARGLKRFQPLDLMAHCREDLRVELKDASAYCQALLRGGYVRVLRTADPAVGREAVYQLVRNTGPRAPRERRVAAIWDPNEAAYAFVSGVGRVERAR